MNTDTKGSFSAAIWDLDGTITRSLEFHFAAFNEVLKPLGLNIEDASVQQSLSGRTAKEAFEILTHQFGLQACATKLASEKEEIFRQLSRGKLEAIEGVGNLLDSLRQAGIKQAIASSGTLANIEHTLSELHFTEFFSTLISSEDVDQGKPAPTPFLLAAKKLGVAPQDCCVIEDAVSGIQAARAAGCKVVAISSYTSADILREADLIIETYEHLTPGRLGELF